MRLWRRSLFEANDLNRQVIQLYNQGRYSEAIPLAQRTLTIREKALGPDHPDVAVALNNLAELYRVQGRYADAEPLYKRALAIREKALGPDHPDVAQSLNNLAVLYDKPGSLCRCGTVVQASVGDNGESARSRSSRCCDIAEQSGVCCTTVKVVMPMRSRCTSARWRYARKRSVPIIPMSRFR